MAEEPKQTAKQAAQLAGIFALIQRKLKDDAAVLLFLVTILAVVMGAGAKIEDMVVAQTSMQKMQTADHQNIERICFRLQIPCGVEQPYSGPSEPSTAVSPIPPMPKRHSFIDPFAGTMFESKALPRPQDATVDGYIPQPSK